VNFGNNRPPCWYYRDEGASNHREAECLGREKRKKGRMDKMKTTDDKHRMEEEN